MDNKKSTVWAMVGAALVVGIGIGFYFGSTGIPEKTSGVAEGTKGIQPTAGSGVLTKDGFSIKIPDGWTEAPGIQGVEAIIMNPAETNTDPAFRQLNFRSYFAVTRDTLSGKSWADYLVSMKSQTKLAIPSIEFTKETDAVVGGNTAHVTEAQMTQDGANFRMLLVAVRGKGDDVWAVSFESAKDMWDGYSQLIDTTVSSFVVR